MARMKAAQGPNLEVLPDSAEEHDRYVRYTVWCFFVGVDPAPFVSWAATQRKIADGWASVRRKQMQGRRNAQ